MTFEKTVKLKGAILTQENLTKLMENLKQYFPDINISVTFKDDNKLSKMRSDEFSHYSFQNKLIKEIEVKGHCYNENHQSHFWGRQDTFDNLVELSFETDNYDNFIKIADIINLWQIEVTDRKNLVIFLHSWGLFLLSCLISFIIILFFKINIKDMLISFLIRMMSSLIYAYMIMSFLKYIFPLTEIDIGTNKRKKSRKFIWILISVLIIPVILSIIF